MNNRVYPYGIDQAAEKLADILIDHADNSGWSEQEREAAWKRLEESVSSTNKPQ